MAVLRADLFEPTPVEPHEIAKSLSISIPRMLDESCEADAERFGHPVFAGHAERAGQQQGASIVVDAIAVQTIRHAMDGMLEQPRVVAHELQMIETDLRGQA